MRTSKALFKWPADWVKVAVVHCTCKLQCSTPVEVGWERDITTPLRNFLRLVLFTDTNRPFFKYHLFNSTQTKFSIESVHFYTNAVTVLPDLVWGWSRQRNTSKEISPQGLGVFQFPRLFLDSFVFFAPLTVWTNGQVPLKNFENIQKNSSTNNIVEKNKNNGPFSSLRKHPFVLALRRWVRFARNVPSGEERGQTDVFAG